MTLRARTPAVEWARRSGAGALVALGWADAAPTSSASSFSITVDDDGAERFFHVSLGDFLPPAMAQAAADSSRAGHPTLLEALQLLLARPQWLVRTRRLWWSPQTPVPALLAALVEAYGMPPDVHRDEPRRLARLAARVARWWPRRGQLEPTIELLRQAADAGPMKEWSHASADLADELMGCHDLDWWAVRQGGAAQLVVRDGLVRFQPSDSPPWPVLREDVVLTLRPNAAIDPSLLRVLPVWLSVRVVASARDAR